MIDLGLSLKPVDDLNVKGTYRFYETDNKGGYIAYNPLTGQFGRGPAGGQAVTTLERWLRQTVAVAAIRLPGFTPVAGCSTLPRLVGGTLANGSNVPVFAEARSTRQYNYGLSADYDLTPHQQLERALLNAKTSIATSGNATRPGKIRSSLDMSTAPWGTQPCEFLLRTIRNAAVTYKYRTFEDLGTGLPGLDVATQVAHLRVRLSMASTLSSV